MGNLKCDHKKTKLKMVAWATEDRSGHKQGFSMRTCCVRCGAVVPSGPNKKKQTFKELRDGRYKAKKERDRKNDYTRKTKHKNKGE